MKNVPLSLERAPPLSVPLRFFLSAPLFGIAAASLLLWAGPQAFASRWTAALLAATHLLTLGFVTMVMCGALMQLIPVVAGVSIPAPRRVAAAVHLPLSLGAAALGPGLALSSTPWTRLALAALAPALAVLVVAAGLALARAPRIHAGVRAMRLALGALVVAAVLGLYLGAGHGGMLAAIPRHLTAIHLAWALLGWVGLLVAGVAYQVVPMFQMTPPYPAVMTRWLGPYLFLGLVAWSLAASWGQAWVSALVGAALALGAGTFAGVTLWLQARRRRRSVDVTLWYWRLAMLSLLLGVVLWAGSLPAPGDVLDLALGVLVIVGVAMSVICGMLYKIVPFLIWLHLQDWRPAPVLSGVPNMKAILPQGAARAQFYLHAGALVLLLGAVLAPGWLLYPAALSLGVSCAALERNLLMALRVYRRVRSAAP